MNKSVISTALVTGGTGFIGTHLVGKLLSENIGVRVLVRPNSTHAHRLKGALVEIVKGDLTDTDVVPKATKGIKTIYHLVGATSHNREAIYKTNIQGTDNLIDAALDHEVERFVLISDTELYDLFSVEDGAKITEDAPIQSDPKTMTYYAYSRIQNEARLFETYRTRGLGVTIIRPGMVVGPMGQILFPHLGYHYHNKLFFTVGKGDNILPLIGVENIVDGIYRASIEKKAIGQVYNLVDDLEITVRDYLEHFIAVTGIKARIVSLPYVVPYLAVATYEMAVHARLLKKGLTSRYQLRWKHSPMLFDNAKAKNELGWLPKIPLRECLTQAFTWYRDRVLEADQPEDSRA